MSEFRILDYNYAFDPTVTIAATTEDVNFPASNLKNVIRGKVWRSTTVAAAQRIVFDLKTAEEIDSVAVMFNPITGPKLTDAATITIKANATNVWDAPAVSQAITIDEVYEVATHFFASAQEYRYWAIEVSDAANVYGYIEIAKIILSKATQLGQLPESGFVDSVEDQSKATSNEYGHTYFDVYPNRRKIDFSYKALSAADVETLYKIYDRVGQVTPIAACLDPTATTFDKDRFFIYGRLSKNNASKNSFYTYFDAALSIEEAM